MKEIEKRLFAHGAIENITQHNSFILFCVALMSAVVGLENEPLRTINFFSEVA